MIEYFKENYLWIGAIVVPIMVAIISAVAGLVKKAGRKQKVGNIQGNGNTIINGNVKEKKDDTE